jgi:hypothetical protein
LGCALLNPTYNFLQSQAYSIKGLPNKKILNYFLWGGHLARPYRKAGKMPAPQYWVIYLLEVPNMSSMNLSETQREEQEKFRFLLPYPHRRGAGGEVK